MFPTGEHRFFHLTWFVYPNKLLINNTNCIFCNSVDSTNVCSQLGSLVGTVAGSHPAQPAQLLRKEIEAMLGSGVRGAGGLAGVWGEGGQGAWLGPAGKSSPRSPAPERGQLWASWEKPGTFQKTRRERFFKSGGGARHERVDKTPGKGTDLAGGRPGLQPRDPQGLPLWTQQSPQFGCLWTSSNKKRMRKIKNNYPSSWFGPKRLSSTWFAKALLSRVERSSRKKDEVFNVCVHLFQMIALRMLSFLFISSFNQVLLRPH